MTNRRYPLVGRATGEDVHAMSFNVHVDCSDWTRPGDLDHWPDRAPLVSELLALEQPTVLGVQEARFGQLDAIREGLGPAYRMVGYGREGGAGGEHAAIFYDADRLTLRWWDQYWLSDTPDVIASATWGNTYTRIVTWARFLDTRTGTELAAVNSHFDHESEPARRRSAETVRAQVAGLGLPTIFTADCNAAAGASSAYDALTGDGGLRDTWTTAAERLTDQVGTFTDYREPEPDGDRIDWILTSPGIAVESAAINTWTADGRPPSDHAAVQAVLRLPR